MSHLAFALIALVSVAGGTRESRFNMPEGFLLGAGTSSYQDEGAWNTDGKGINVLDEAFHKNASKKNGDIAADFYHRYKEDLQIAADLKFNVFRFSISWTRIFPDGNISNVNEKGRQHYHEVIDEIRRLNMKPLCTMYHFDHPQVFEEFGGWLSEKMIDAYVEYATFLFKEYGSKVDLWTTINEPNMHCSLVYNGIMPPGVAGVKNATNVYKCIHHELLAHARAYRVHQSLKQNGRVGLSAVTILSRPNSTAVEDVMASYKCNMFDVSILLHPLVYGDYPPIVRHILEEKGMELPTFTSEQREMLVGSHDYIGLNAYSGTVVAAPGYNGSAAVAADSLVGAFFRSMVGPMSDAGIVDTSASDTVIPWILRDVSLWIKEHYGASLPIFFTENGRSTPRFTGVNDWDLRAVYHSLYLRELFRTINEDKVNVIGYTVWAFLDGFEFQEGYEDESGLVYVEPGSLNRSPKKSTAYLKQVIAERYADAVSGCIRYTAQWILIAVFSFFAMIKV